MFMQEMNESSRKKCDITLVYDVKYIEIYRFAMVHRYCISFKKTVQMKNSSLLHLS